MRNRIAADVACCALLQLWLLAALPTLEQMDALAQDDLMKQLMCTQQCVAQSMACSQQ